MNDSLCVCCGDGIEYAVHQHAGLGDGYRAVFAQMFSEAFARNVFKDQIGVTILLAGIKNRHNVWMTQFADHSGFGQQILVLALAVFGEMQGLDCHFTL